MTNLQAAVLGVIFGGGAGGVLASFLLFTRSARRVHSPLMLGVGYVLLVGSALGSVLLLFGIGDRMGVGRHSFQHDVSVDAFGISYAIVGMFGLRAEFKWRKSTALDSQAEQLSTHAAKK